MKRRTRQRLMALVAADGTRLAANPQLSGVLFYLLAHAFMTLGAFAALSLLSRGGEAVTVDGLRGLAREQPWLAAGLTLCLLSLAGVPPTMGFVGRTYLLSATVSGGWFGLAALGAVASGSVGLGLVYRTDAAASDEVRVLDEVPADELAITYGGGVLADTKLRADAEDFLALVTGADPDGAAVLERHGFLVRSVAQ